MELNPQIPDGNDPNNPVRIYTDGIFDCFHYGHARVLEQCKKMFKNVHLLVGVCNDEDTWREKGKGIMLENERVESVKHCKWADEVIFPAPWVLTLKFLDVIGAHYVAHDPEPYPFGDIVDLYGEFKIAKRFLATARTEGISTTDIIARIIKNYDLYIERSINKGCTAEELNIPKPKYLAVKMYLLDKKRKKEIFTLLKKLKKNN